MLRALLVLGCLLISPLLAAAPSVVFINPGKSDEPYWRDAALAMQQAASALGIELQVLWAERDYLAQISLTAEVAARDPAARPDYLLIAADKRTLAEQLALANSAGLPVLSVYNAVQDSERDRVGYPRGALQPFWLGSLVPRAEDAGVLSAQGLLAAAAERGWLEEGQVFEVVAISGDRSSDTSIRRNRGMQQVLAEYPGVVLHQVVHADWQVDKAAQQALHLYRRYPGVRGIWAGSDSMAFGAMQALAGQGVEPGQSMLFAAVNASEPGMQAVIDGRLAALAGGHHLAGAWGLVMLYDHYHGIDFAASEGTELVHPMFTLFTPALARRFLSLQQDEHLDIDFCHFSKVCNPGLERYNFSIAAWLELTDE